MCVSPAGAELWVSIVSSERSPTIASSPAVTAASESVYAAVALDITVDGEKDLRAPPSSSAGLGTQLSTTLVNCQLAYGAGAEVRRRVRLCRRTTMRTPSSATSLMRNEPSAFRKGRPPDIASRSAEPAWSRRWRQTSAHRERHPRDLPLVPRAKRRGGRRSSVPRHPRNMLAPVSPRTA